MKIVFALSVLVFAVACTSTTQPRFERMSDEELIAYNNSVPAQDQVYCRDEVQVGSHIRRRVCARVQDVVNGTQTTLGIPSSSASVPNRQL